MFTRSSEHSQTDLIILYIKSSVKKVCINELSVSREQMKRHCFSWDLKTHPQSLCAFLIHHKYLCKTGCPKKRLVFECSVHFELCNSLNGKVMTSTCYSPEARFSSSEDISLEANKSLTKNNMPQAFKVCVFFSWCSDLFPAPSSYVFRKQRCLMVKEKRDELAETDSGRYGIWSICGEDFRMTITEQNINIYSP